MPLDPNLEKSPNAAYRFGALAVALTALAAAGLVVAPALPEALAGGWRNALTVVFAGLLLAALSANAVLLRRQVRVTSTLSREIEESALRLNSVIDSAMDAIVTVDAQQNIVLFNAAAERIFECPAAQAIGTPLEQFIPQRYREAHRHHVRHFGEAGVTTRRMGAELVLAGVRRSGEEFPIDASISYASVAGQKLCTVILRDVTERVRAQAAQRDGERQLRESEQRLQSIIGSAMDAIITIDQKQHILLFNEAAQKIFGYRAADVIGTSIDRLLPERYRHLHAAHVKRFGDAGVTTRRMGGALVLAGLRSDGLEFPIDASISHADVGGHKLYTVILRDITERQKAADALVRSHHELRELYEAMHQVREAERTRIARELHDELAQWLTALKMDVSWLRTRLAQDDALLITRAERMKSVVDNTIRAMRRIAADLRPVMLDDLGLIPALEHLLHELSDRTGIEIRLRGGEDVQTLREPLVTAVYRMVQEALTNVARHSGATAVSVELSAVDARLRVSVRDNGRGLQPDPTRKSFGLLGIRERASTLGGEARIHTAGEGGTVVEIEVPLVSSTPLEAGA